MRESTALEFLGILYRMDFMPSHSATKADISQFLRQITHYKGAQAAYLEASYELSLARNCSRFTEKECSLKEDRVAKCNRLLDRATVCLERVSQDFLSCFPQELIEKADEVMSDVDESVKRHMHSDIEARFQDGTLFQHMAGF